MHLFIYKYLVSIYYIEGSSMSAGDKRGNKGYIQSLLPWSLDKYLKGKYQVIWECISSVLLYN